MRYMCRQGLLLLTICLLSRILFGQPASRTPQQPASEPDISIKVNVDLIQIDVTVQDKSGKPVPGLTTEDFEVSRDGKKQNIKGVLYVQRKTDPAAAGAPTISSAIAKQLEAKEVRRTIAIFIDDLSINFENLPAVQAALQKFVEGEVVPGDLVAVYRSSGGIGIFEQFTNNKRALLESVSRIRYRSLNGVDSLAPIKTDPNENDPNTTIAQMALQQRLAEEAVMRTRQDILTASILSSASFVVRGLRELPGRKSMVLFSESVQLYDAPQTLNNRGADAKLPGAEGGARQRTRQAMHNLVDLANISGVTFYTVDPRRLQTLSATAADDIPANVRTMGRVNQRVLDFSLSQDGLASLADETGGLFFRNTNDLGKAMEEAAKDQDGYYLVAFQPDSETFERTKQGGAKLHKLSIKVRQPNTKVRYRRSFTGLADADRKSVVSSNPLVSALFSPLRSAEIPLKLTPIYAESDAGPVIRAMLHVDVRNLQFQDEPASPDDPDKTGWKKAVADEVFILYDQNGKSVAQELQPAVIRVRQSNAFETALREGVVQVVDIPVKQPGAYQLRAAVMDQATKRTGSAAQFLFIPDVKNKQLAMSDLAIVAESYLQSKSTGGAPGMRVMRGGDKLVYSAYIYNSKLTSGKKPNLEIQVVLYRDGKPVFTGKKTPYQPDGAQSGEGSPVPLTGNISLASSLEKGEYVLQVAVRDLDAPKKYSFALRTADFEVH
jgi:VWFA-related protein